MSLYSPEDFDFPIEQQVIDYIINSVAKPLQLIQRVDKGKWEMNQEKFEQFCAVINTISGR